MVLDEIALSADILWEHKAEWVEKIKARRNELVTLDPVDDRIPEEVQVDDERIGEIDQQEEVDVVERLEEALNEQHDVQLVQDDAAQEN